MSESLGMLHWKFFSRRFLLASLAILAAGPRSAGAQITAPLVQERTAGAAEASSGEEVPQDKRGVAIVQHGGYPELQVDGQPFFIHSAAFFYARIPRSLWESSLDRYRELGINTIDFYIPWNWHEPREGELDFDGRTNPRRDLRGLLQLIARKGFRCIARPGPTILNEWRNGGYPEWLLARPEYAMPPRDLIEGRYPPLANLNARNAEAAAHGWLENPVHMTYARKWLASVARELAPYRASGLVSIPAAGKDRSHDVSGPLLFVQLEDDMAIGRFNTAGPAFWRYMETLRGFLASGGLDVPAFINPEDMRVSATGSGVAPQIGAMGQWYLQPSSQHPPGDRSLTTSDASTIEFLTRELATQPAFPPVMIEYQAGWYAPGNDTRPRPSSASNTLLSTRLLLAYGLHGLNHFPLQDTLYPAGYETPWTNRHYRWDAALSLNGFRQARARAVQRTADVLELWDGFLASSHQRADFGLVYPLGSFPQESLGKEEIAQVSQTILRIERVAQLAGLSGEILDPEYQPVEQLLRHPLLLLPVFEPTTDKLRMSDRAARRLVDYVRRGGILFTFPTPPQGDVLGELWKARPPKPRELPGGATAWPFGSGQVVSISKDFYSWVVPDEDFAVSRSRFEADWAIHALRGLISYAGIRPVVEQPVETQASAAFVVTELTSNEGTGMLGTRSGGVGLVSVTNLNSRDTVETALSVLSPRAGAGNQVADYLTLRVTVPPRESLLLPVHFSLCSAPRPADDCDDEVAIAGAELLRAERKEKNLELTFYTPARATVRLRLRERPAHVTLEDGHLDASWSEESRELEVDLPRGAAPDFRRVLKVRMRYTPRVHERPDPGRPLARPDHWINYLAVGAVRLPLGEDTSLLTEPPLFVVSGEPNESVVLAAENRDESSHDIEFHIEGPFSGSAAAGIPPHEFRILNLKLHQERPVTPFAGARPGADAPDAIFHEQMTITSGTDRIQTPVYFVVMPVKGTVGYRYDFDRDAIPEWVLENARLRLIVSPEEGGRAIALVDKVTGQNLATTIGLLADHFSFTPDPPGINPDRAHGRYGLFNRPYRPEWISVDEGRGIRLSYHAPDVAPSGALVEKTIRLLDAQRFAVDYDVVLDAAPPASGASGAGSVENLFAAPLPEGIQQAFVAVNSIPAHPGGELGTRFCWPTAPLAAAKEVVGTVAGRATDSNSAAQQCQSFVPGGDSLLLPTSATRLEIRTAGRPGLLLEWKNARMTVEMENYSALLRLEFHTLQPGGAPIRPHLEFTVLENE